NFGTFVVELNGTNAGTGYDQLNVTGAVNLASCALNISLGYAPASGDKFTIINNDGADAITGTFAGLPEGATTNIGSVAIIITYAGGSGNDVVLTALPFAS